MNETMANQNPDGHLIEVSEMETHDTNREEPMTVEKREEREKWASHLEYILAMVGYTVGMGNLIRFPYVCNRNGGGAFLIPYFIFLFGMGLPMFLLEASLGQFSGKNTIHVWSFCPILKGTGIASTILSTINATYYNLLQAWAIYYMIKSCTKVLPWITCDNSWNTPLCVEDIISNRTNSSWNGSTALSVAELWENKSLAHTSAEEFWQYNVLSVSSGIDEIGSVQWHIAGCLLAAYLIIIFCLSRGVKSVGKVVYVTALLPYVLLIVILIRTSIQPGAIKGMLYYIQPDLNHLLTLQVWLEAGLQVFYSVGVGWGFICMAASHNKFHDPCMRDSFLLAIISEGTSVFGGFVTFTILGVIADRVSVPISKVVSSGPGLAFVAYPTALAQLPFPQVWSFLFFLMLLSVGLDSELMTIEVFLAALTEGFPRVLKHRRLVVLCGVCLVYFLLGMIFCTQGGPYFFQIIDWYIASLTPFLVCILECFGAVWLYGINHLSSDIEMMLGKPLPKLIRFLWAFVIPGTLLMALILTLTRYQPPTYGKYIYPDSATAFGWVIATVSLIPLPICAIISVRKHMTSNSITKGIVSAAQPDRQWKPASEEYGEMHERNALRLDRSFFGIVKGIFGR